MNKESLVIIDAAGKKLGRLATEISVALRRKNTADFAPQEFPAVMVTVTNASKIDMSDKKGEHKIKSYSGYPGGLKQESAAHLMMRRGIKPVLEHAVMGMLPKNKLRKRFIQMLTIEN